MSRTRWLAALLFTLAVLCGASAAGAQAQGPDGGDRPSTSTTVSTTVTITVPAGPGGELARTGPAHDTAGLGVFGFLLLGVGAVAIVGSRRLLATEHHRR